ncbi:Putative serine hydrolase FSH, alpha/Beta hydrolase [Septoria linicola]|uniref:Serine hydrolase FSH, alpha/Beta hydrolase n=1 Tax=Septoria linicola TaxID=215465 RepID=A0A9Q9AM01_9PEZI|nr:putative serine hydrolase FSH, alpha/Beta hydrolase [Septoria linicola]USW50529.1 Putative serine hydrolase FSH, alpha/Beta hydrolase [Septoria linicola]
MSSEPQKLRILMLHGFTQSGPLFEIKTKALKKALEKAFPAAPKPGHLKDYPGGLEFFYPTGPMKLSYTDVPGGLAEPEDLRDEAYAWWKRKGETNDFLYDGLEAGLEAISNVLREEGPFHGVIGFSQGGSASGIIAALLQPGRKEAFDEREAEGGIPFPESFIGEGEPDSIVHPQLKFAVSYSGPGPSRHPKYRALYEPKITTPMQHFIGSVDTVVSEEKSMQLVESCVDGKGREGGVGRVVFHPGGHFLPTQKATTAPLIAFIREIVDGGAVNGSHVQEESVEDMDVPF